MIDSEDNKVRKSRKKAAIKPYTLLWFLELLFYGFYRNGVAYTRFLAYINPTSWVFWLFPSLKARHAVWFKKKTGTTLEGYRDKLFNDPVNGLNNWYASWAMFMLLFCTFLGIFNLFCILMRQDLYVAVHPLLPFVTVGILSNVATDYLDWNKRHLPYFKEFDKLSGFRKYWLGWFCTLLFLSSIAFWIRTIPSKSMRDKWSKKAHAEVLSQHHCPEH